MGAQELSHLEVNGSSDLRQRRAAAREGEYIRLQSAPQRDVYAVRDEDVRRDGSHTWYSRGTGQQAQKVIRETVIGSQAQVLEQPCQCDTPAQYLHKKSSK
jgi:hypothetical protein